MVDISKAQAYADSSGPASEEGHLLGMGKEFMELCMYRNEGSEGGMVDW